MGKKILYLYYILSGIVFFVSISEWMTSSLIFSAALGFLLGLGEYLFLTKFKPKFSKFMLAVSLFAGAIISLLAVKSFYDTWITSVNTVRTIVTKIFPDYSEGLFIISIFVGIMILPFASCLVGLIPQLVKALRMFEYKKIWAEFVKDVTFVTILKRVAIVAANVLAACLAGTVLLYAVYLLPVDRIDAKVASSAQTIADEDMCPSVFSWMTSKVDNYTDSIMLLEAASASSGSAMNDAMNVPRGDIGELDPYDTIVSHYVDGNAYDETITYSRYWHGYLIFLKPLLQFLDYRAIRIINGIVQAITVLATCFLLFKKGHKKAVVPYFLSFLMLMPVAMAKAFQYSTCFYTFAFGCIALLLLRDEKRRKAAGLVFLWCGIATAYFDLLTYPISTFGVPMMFYLLLADKEDTESKLSQIVRNAIYWCIGLGAMWFSKWTIATIITGENKFTDALGKVAERTSTVSEEGESYSFYSAEIRNFGAFFLTPVTILAAILIIYMICKLLKKDLTIRDYVRTLFPFLLTGLAPVAWYAFATNHSVIHYWFTNKACVVSFLGIVFGLVCLLQTKEKALNKKA
ncbi:MAG: hypothetical protein IKO15_08290 [Clostridiales bacterium]|nr:hypothetical protein [Clostridiales bacterium]